MIRKYTEAPWNPTDYPNMEECSGSMSSRSVTVGTWIPSMYPDDQPIQMRFSFTLLQFEFYVRQRSL